MTHESPEFSDSLSLQGIIWLVIDGQSHRISPSAQDGTGIPTVGHVQFIAKEGDDECSRTGNVPRFDDSGGDLIEGGVECNFDGIHRTMLVQDFNEVVGSEFGG